MSLKHSSLVSSIRDFPIGCGPYPNLNPKTQSHFAPSNDHQHHNDEDYEPFQDLDDLNEITGDSPSKKSGSGSGSKRKVSGIRHFPRGCETSVSGYSDDYLDEEEKPEYPDWFGMIDFEEHITEDQDPVSCPCRNLIGDGSDKDMGLDPEKPGFGFRNPTHIQESAKKSGCGGIVLALSAPQFCPWRNRKGKLKKGRSRK